MPSSKLQIHGTTCLIWILILLQSQMSLKKATLKRRLGEADDNGAETKNAINKEKGASSSASRKVKVAKVETVDLTNED